MQQLQTLLSETNLYLGGQHASLSVPIIPEGTLYQLSHTEIEMPLTYGNMARLPEDYEQQKGIGAFIQPIFGIDRLFSETREAANKITGVAHRHSQTLRDMAALCHKYMINTSPDSKRIHRGGLFRVVFTAKAALYQILFNAGGNSYYVAYEGSLESLTEGKTYTKKPFSHIPPLFQIPKYHGSTDFIAADFGSITDLLNTQPLNAKAASCRSQRSNIFNGVLDMADDFLSA